MTAQNVKKLVMAGLFIALDIIFTRFLSYETPTLRIGLSFLPIALCAAVYGPVTGGITAAAADVLGMMLFPKYAYFPGFTLTAFLTGAAYGLFLHKSPRTFPRICASVAVVCLLLNLGLDTLWIYIIQGKGLFAMLPERIIKASVMIPIQIIVIKSVLQVYAGLWEQNKV